MNNSDLVSVIIPAYNAEKFIHDTLQSVSDQSWANIEIIVVNDGSTDNTETVVKNFSERKNIIYISQPNKGCSSAKNTGLRVAKGDFIQYLDADDLLSSDKIHEQVTAIRNDPMKVAVCKTKIFGTDHKGVALPEINTEMLYDSESTLEFLLNLYGLNGKKGMIQPNAFLISKLLAEKAGPYDVSISPSPDEDGEYFCRVLLSASSVSYTRSGTNFYRRIIKSSSLSAQHSFNHARGGLRSLELKAKHLLEVENSHRVRKLMAEHYADYIYQYYGQFRQLAVQAENNIIALGINRIPNTGGRNFKLLAGIVGMKPALRVKEFFKGNIISVPVLPEA